MKKDETLNEIIKNLKSELKKLGAIEAKIEHRLLAKKDKGDLVCMTSALLDLESTIDYLECYGNPNSEIHENIRRRDADRREEQEQMRRYNADQKRIKRRAMKEGYITIKPLS
jgi:hypothetical protein